MPVRKPRKGWGNISVCVMVQSVGLEAVHLSIAKCCIRPEDLGLCLWLTPGFLGGVHFCCSISDFSAELCFNRSGNQNRRTKLFAQLQPRRAEETPQSNLSPPNTQTWLLVHTAPTRLFTTEDRFCTLSMFGGSAGNFELLSGLTGLAAGKFWITSDGMFCLLPPHIAKRERLLPLPQLICWKP